MYNTAMILHSADMKDRYKCTITETLVVIESGVCVKTYGLYLYNESPFLARLQGESCRIDDITESYDQALRLKELVEEMDIYPVHLRDVVEDFLS